MNIVFSIYPYSTGELFVSTLRKKFEEHYHDYDDNALSVKWFKTVPQAILVACGRIPSIEALEIIELGLGHPYSHVERVARTSVGIWYESVVKSGKKDPHLLKKVIEVSQKYDNNILYKSWSTFKKAPGVGYMY